MEEQKRIETTTETRRNKCEIFIITFFGYMAVHAMRTTYSSSKEYIIIQTGIEEKYIGIPDFIMLFFVGIGNLMIALRKGPGKINKPVYVFSSALLLSSIFYFLLPLFLNITKGLTALFVLILLIGILGLIQGFTFANLLSIIGSATDSSKDTLILGIWGTNANFGNILGFIICEQIILKNGLPWQTSMYIVAVILIVMGFIFKCRIPELKIKTEEQEKNIEQSPSEVMERESHLSFWKIIRSPKIIFLTLSFSLYKSILYGILLWLPIYFYDVGLKKDQFYIPIAFDISSIIGSILLGSLFKVISPTKRKVTLVPILLVMIICFSVLKSADLSPQRYFIAIFVVGICLGGSFNTMSTLVTMQLSKTVPKKFHTTSIKFFSALLMTFGNIITAITQIIISFGVGKSNETKLFAIFLSYSCINLLSMIIIIFLERKGVNSNHIEDKPIHFIEERQEETKKVGTAEELKHKNEEEEKQLSILDEHVK